MKTKEAVLLEIFETKIPFNRFLGIRIGKIEPGRVRLLLPFREEFIGDSRRPSLHGGVISALMDTAGGAAAWTELDISDRLSTIDLLVDFLLPAGAGTLEADARLLRIGNRVAVVHITVHEQGRKEMIAQGRAVYSILREKKKENS